MAKTALRMQTGVDIQRCNTAIQDDGKKVASEIKNLVNTLFVCKARTWLIEDLSDFKKKLTKIDSNLAEAATFAYLLSGYLTKGEVKANPPKFTVPSDMMPKPTIKMDTELAREAYGKVKSRMGSFDGNIKSLQTIKAEISSIRPEDIQMNDIEYMAARFLTLQGLSKYRTVVQAKNHIENLLEKSIRDLNSITMNLATTILFLPGKIAAFESVEDRAKHSLFEEQLKRSAQMKTWKDAGKQQTKDRIAELKAAQAEYVALYGKESPRIAAEIARLRELRIEAAIQDGLTRVGDGGYEFKEWYYNSHKGTKKPSEDFAWCDRFAAWMVAQMGYTLPCGYVSSLADYCQKKGAFHSPEGYQPRNGDVVFFNWNGTSKYQHVGIIHINENGEVYVLHGNQGDKVAYEKLSDLLKDKKGNKHVLGYADPTKLPERK